MIHYCQLARKALEQWLRTHQPMSAPAGSWPKAACFVSLHKNNGELRGCIGTLKPSKEHLGEEIIANAIAAGTTDPRFPPVKLCQLPDLGFKVSVLSAPQPIKSTAGLNPKRYGIIVANGHRRGVLLPGLEGITTIDQQLSIACKKAGIHPNEPLELSRFEVTWHDEP